MWRNLCVCVCFKGGWEGWMVWVLSSLSNLSLLWCYRMHWGVYWETGWVLLLYVHWGVYWETGWVLLLYVHWGVYWETGGVLMLPPGHMKMGGNWQGKGLMVGSLRNSVCFCLGCCLKKQDGCHCLLCPVSLLFSLSAQADTHTDTSTHSATLSPL
jgi:hypothetical protein